MTAPATRAGRVAADRVRGEGMRSPGGSAPLDSSGGRRPKVLLVDDRPENLTALQAVLEPLELDLCP